MFVLLLGYLGLLFTFVCSCSPAPTYMQVNGLTPPSLLPHPAEGLCYWSAVLSGEGGPIIVRVCSGNRDNHPATGVSDTYSSTILDDETERLLCKVASPTRRRMKKKSNNFLEGKVRTKTGWCQVLCLFIQWSMIIFVLCNKHDFIFLNGKKKH